VGATVGTVVAVGGRSVGEMRTPPAVGTTVGTDGVGVERSGVEVGGAWVGGTAVGWKTGALVAVGGTTVFVGVAAGTVAVAGAGVAAGPITRTVHSDCWRLPPLEKVAVRRYSSVRPAEFGTGFAVKRMLLPCCERAETWGTAEVGEIGRMPGSGSSV
jgi:hypothetical protein